MNNSFDADKILDGLHSQWVEEIRYLYPEYVLPTEIAFACMEPQGFPENAL